MSLGIMAFSNYFIFHVLCVLRYDELKYLSISETDSFFLRAAFGTSSLREDQNTTESYGPGGRGGCDGPWDIYTALYWHWHWHGQKSLSIKLQFKKI